MKIYTKTGDQGTTSLLGGVRVPKHHIRIDTYGNVDELNSWVGLLRDQDIPAGMKEELQQIQDKLFCIGSMLALAPETKQKKKSDRFQIPEIASEDISFLESSIDRMNESLSEMTHFILPGGHPVVSHCHIARTVCRRAERQASLLAANSEVDEMVLVYLNRLSDYLFVLARKLSKELDADEIKWIP